MKRCSAACLLAFLIGPCVAMENDDPVLTKVMFNEMEIRRTSGDSVLAWDVEAWLGRDIDKLWFKAEGERDDGESTTNEYQLLYSRAVSDFWNLNVGWRGDTIPDRDWFVVGMQGLAPYFVEVDANLFIGGSGNSGLRINIEREFLLTRRLMLAPELEVNAFVDDDEAAARGAGISALDASLRLYYRLRPNFAPYAGILWEQSIGETRGLRRSIGEDTSEFQLVIGLYGWF